MTPAELKQRRQAAQAERDGFQPLLDDAYDYAIPYRRSAKLGKNQKRVDRIFDHTATTSAFRGAGRLQQDLCPPGVPFFAIEPGYVALQGEKGALDELRKTLKAITSVLTALTLTGEWDQAFIEMAIDLQASTGCMFILPHESEPKARFVAVPLDEILLEQGPYNDIAGVFWTRKWSLRQLSDTFGGEKGWPTPLARLARDGKWESEFELHQDVVRDPKTGQWVLVAWLACEGDHVLRESRSFTKPCITPRYHRLTGETYGRGPIMLAMPTIKTLNTAQKLTLQAAAIAMLGIYTVLDDGVFNADASPLEPGAMWKVARNGGVLGPSVSRFPDPRLDVSNIVLQELRLSVQSAMNDQALPPDGAAVKSATEILERVKRLASDHIGAYGRFVNELIVPAVERLIEIAHMKGLITERVAIDQLLVKITVAAPIAMAREIDRVQRIVEWLQMVTMFAQQSDPGRTAKFAEALAEIGRAMAVDEKFILSAAERDAYDQAAAQQAQAAAVAQTVAAAAGVKP